MLAEIRRIASAEKPGTRLPTVRDLVMRFGVSQHAVQSALAALSAEGMITTHVGRGTFVSDPNEVSHGTRPRSVLTLLNQTEYERGDIIGQMIHQRLLAQGHRSLLLTYSNPLDAMSMLKDGPHHDACIVQPRTSTLPVQLLGLLKERSDFVLVENRAVESMDVDAISNDPAAAVAQILDHLVALGHRRIGWVVEQHEDYFYDRTIPLFHAYRRWNRLSDLEAPVVYCPKRARGFGFADLEARLGPILADGAKRPTALALLTFDTAERILDAFDRLGLRVPADISLVRIGSPDLEADHGNRLATLGRPSSQAAETVLKRLEWRWANPEAAFGTVYDQPRLEPYRSTAPLAS